MDSKLLQPKKAFLPIAVTEAGIAMDCKLLQPKKTASPIAVTEAGISMDCKLLHSAKASLNCGNGIRDINGLQARKADLFFDCGNGSRDTNRLQASALRKDKLPNCGNGSRDINGLQAPATAKGRRLDCGYRISLGKFGVLMLRDDLLLPRGRTNASIQQPKIQVYRATTHTISSSTGGMVMLLFWNLNCPLSFKLESILLN